MIGRKRRAMGEEVVKKFITRLELDSKKYTIGLKDARGHMVDFERVTKTLALGVGAIGTAFAAVGTAAIALAKKTANVGDEYDALSQKIGISVEKLSSYSHLAKLSNTDLGALSSSVGILSRNMSETAQNTGTAKEAFKALGIDVKDQNGNLKDADTMLKELSGKFAEMPNGVQKTALSMEFFGRSGRDMIPILNEGAKGIGKLLDEGKKYRSWTESEAKESALLNDNLDRLGMMSKGGAEAIGKQLIPAMQSVTEMTLEWVNANENVMNGYLGKLPDVINYLVVPALSTLATQMNMVTMLISGAWSTMNLQFMSNIDFMAATINKFVQGLVSIGKYIPGIGDKIKGFGDASQNMYNALHEVTVGHLNDLKSIPKTYQENQDKIEKTQEMFILGYEESRKRMAEADKKANKQITQDIIIETEEQRKERERKLEEDRERAKKEQEDLERAAKERAEKIAMTEQDLRDRVFEMDNDKYDNSRYKLEQEYEDKRKNVEDKALLDDWYRKEYNRISDEQYTEEEKLAKKAADEEQKEKEKKYQWLYRAQDEWISKVSEGANLEKSLAEASGHAVMGIIERDTQERVKTLTDAAIKIVTGHVAEGLSMVGASGVTIWDSLGNIALYIARIGAQIAGSRAIARSVKFASGGWLGDHPRGGVINSGATGGRADDVYLGSGAGNSFYGSRGESVFIMNANATKKYAPMLSAMNISTGFAEGGMLGTITRAVSGAKGFSKGMSKEDQVKAAVHNLTLGVMKNTLAGWAMAGDFLQGIPFGVKDAGINVGIGIPSMFAGKLLTRNKMKGALGFGLGGWLKNPLGELKSIGSKIKDFIKDPFGTLGDIIKGSLMDALGFDKIMSWIMKSMRYIPGFTDVASSLVGSDLSMPKVNVMDHLRKNITIKNLVRDFLPKFDNGGVITANGLEPFPSGHVAFAGIGQPGEVLSPVGAGGGITINFTLNGIDRQNARSAVKDYIVPELNYYFTSRGMKTI
jgi:hypothetical protein